ncbi:Capsule biosynthesis protein capA [hydrothermal vent metagenome]|uniref:Capsule biosynthesis protein capA n=1 Tax=hydrothermal vent metagenome TaxID=652676 RepID=A0A3B0RM84_9ZZZZ
MNVILMLFLLLWLGVAPVIADSYLSGNILDENASAIESFTVLVGDAESYTGQGGTFSVPVNENNIITLQVTAEGYYSARHSFSPQELRAGKNGKKYIPPITLVARKKQRVMLAFGGDVMMGRRFAKPRAGEQILIRPQHRSGDTKEIVKYIKPYFGVADFGSVNLETQVMARKPEGSMAKSITFFSPPETVDALAWAGVDYVTLGNNHTFDNLKEGLLSTIDTLTRSPLGFSGAGLNEQQALEAYRTDISGVPYSFLGYVGWKGGSRPHQAAEGPIKGGAALGSMANIIKTVDREVADNQTTIVQYHGSLEYSEEPTLVTEQKLKTAIDRGADIAIAHHPHVVQGFEIYKDRLIAYSLGNFIFDQYYYAPQFSYMLYVWMDGEKFHRAEIVPLYVKGYKPTPAVGIIRTAILRRTASLSARRNVTLGYSGGHGVITKKEPVSPQKIKMSVNVKRDQRILNLDHCEASQYFSGLSTQNESIQYRLGQELLRRGDFEHFNSFKAPERGWVPQNEDSGVVSKPVYEGRKAFKVTADSGEKKSTFGMKIFTRVYKAGNPMTFTGYVYGDEATNFKFYMQTRPRGRGLAKSLKKGPEQVIGTLSVAQGAWQKFSFDFNTPRVGVHSFRMLVEASGKGGRVVAPVYFDDVGLVQWQTAYRESGIDQERPVPNRVTHIGLRGLAGSGELEISLMDFAKNRNGNYECHIE